MGQPVALVVDGAVASQILKRTRANLRHAGGCGVAIAFFSLGTSATGCPICASDTGKVVRSIIFGDEFIPNLISMASPFLILLTLIGLALVWHILPQRRSPRSGKPL